MLSKEKSRNFIVVELFALNSIIAIEKYQQSPSPRRAQHLSVAENAIHVL